MTLLKTKISTNLEALKIDALLITDFRGRDPFARQILGLNEHKIYSRRWFGIIKKNGECLSICHRIEPSSLAEFGDKTLLYSSRNELEQVLKEALKGIKTLALFYSPLAAIPYVSTIDAGIFELIKECGVIPVSADELLQRCFTVLTKSALEDHLEAGRRVDAIRYEAFELLKQRADKITEFEAVQFILKRFKEEELETDHPPCVAVNQNSAIPHYEPSLEKPVKIHRGDFVLIDLWAKLKKSGAIYYDVTWCGVLRNEATEEEEKIFSIVKDARDAAVSFIEEKRAFKKKVKGFEADDIARKLIAKAGYEKNFIHRLGHSISTTVHGEGANLDNFETHDTRELISWSCFSVEPGIYLEKFGVRSELNLFLTDTETIIGGEVQKELLKLGY